MKNYKDYNKTYIGSSDSAYLTLKTITGTTEKLCFGEDGSYSAYVVDEDTLIPKHYHKEFEFTDSLEIYNNFGELEWSAKAKQISVYTAGNFGCLIKLQGAENYKYRRMPQVPYMCTKSHSRTDSKRLYGALSRCKYPCRNRKGFRNEKPQAVML